MFVRFQAVWAYVLCALIIAFADAQQQPPANSSQIDKLTKFYFDKCYRYSKEAKSFDTLWADATRLMDDLERSLALLPDNKKIFCDERRRHLEDRMEKVSKDLKPCLPPEEQFLPDFIETSFEEILHFLCHNNGEYMDGFFSTQGTYCRSKIEADKTDHLDNCFSKIFAPLSRYVTKQEICNDVDVVKRCFDAVLQKKCPNFKAFKELNSRFFEYVGKPCSGCVFYLNVVLLALSVIVTNIFTH